MRTNITSHYLTEEAVNVSLPDEGPDDIRMFERIRKYRLRMKAYIGGVRPENTRACLPEGYDIAQRQRLTNLMWHEVKYYRYACARDPANVERWVFRYKPGLVRCTWCGEVGHVTNRCYLKT